MISDDLLTWFIELMNWYFNLSVGSLGLLLNVINVVVFTRMGFSDSTNISLLSLAVADVGVLLTTVGYSITHSPYVMETTGREFRDVLNFSVLGSSHILFSRIAGLLTAFITLERFLCVAWPFHVRSLITPARTTAVVVSVYVVMTLGSVTIFVANQIGTSFNPERNVTVYGLVTLPNSGDLESVTLTIHMIAQMTSFVVVAVSTVGLIRSLVRVSRWRTVSSSLRLSSAASAEASGREKQLVKVAVLIDIVFIVCSLPTVVGNLVMIFVKDYSIKGSARNVFVFTFVVFYFLDAVNSTVTIFIYIKMSSRFRAQFLALFRCRGKEKRNKL